MKRAKIIVCTQNNALKVSEAVKKSKTAINIKTQVLCLGEEENLLNLFTLLKDVDDEHIVQPVSIKNPDQEKIITFWSSGTSGKFWYFLWMSEARVKYRS